MRIWWDPAVVQGNPDFLGVIPGGQSFVIPQGKITQVPSQGTGFTYKPSVRAGTYMYIVAGDNRGNGTGGAFGTTVAAGINTDNSCLSNNSPSSTPGSPAGGSYATGTNGAGTVGNTGGASGGSSGKSSTNIGAIVGGVIGGVVLFIVALLLFWFYRRRQKKYRRTKERPVDLLNAEDDGDDSPDHANGRTRANELPEYYRPEPFMVPDPTADGASVNGAEEDGRRPLSGTANSFYTRDGTPEPHSASMSGFGPGIGGSSVGGERRKGGAPRPMRAVNIIQHDDAGPSLPKESEDEPETIELPPAYTAVGRTKSPEGSPSPPVPGATAAAGAAEPPAAAQ
ncbi:hypothetical protein CPC08DRAFT_727066 [Agrocybe pediades]|nr:hypothetical protein CPC08DRAFT_727066 [Agrocybe pediades]